MSEITVFLYPLSQTQPLCLSVLRLIRRRDQTRDGGGHFSAQLPVLPGSDPGLCGNGTSDLTGGRGSGSDVLCKPDVIRGLPVLLSLRGVPAAPPWGWAPRKRDPATVGAHLAKAFFIHTTSHTHTHAKANRTGITACVTLMSPAPLRVTNRQTGIGRHYSVCKYHQFVHTACVDPCFFP